MMGELATFIVMFAATTNRRNIPIKAEYTRMENESRSKT